MATGPSAEEASVLALTTAVARGDAAAFERLYRAWFDRLVALAQRATGRDEAFAMDVVQEAFLRVIRSCSPIATEIELAAWLRARVLSAAVDRLRSECRRQRRESSPWRPHHPAPEPPASDQLIWLAQRLEEMDPGDRELLRLRYAIDRTLESIGVARGTNTGVVQGRLHRALARLRSAAREFLP